MKSKFFLVLSVFIAVFTQGYTSPKFIKKLYPNSKVTIHQAYDPIEALGSADIYYVDDSKVIKLFNLNDSNARLEFEAEIKAYQFADENKLPAIKMLHFEKKSYRGKTYGILTLEKAPGISLNQMLKSFKKTQDSKQIETALELIAQAMAQFHKAPSKFSSDIATLSDRATIKHLLTHFSDQKEKLLKEFHLKKLLHHPIQGIIHQDLHPGNIFIQTDNQSCKFIDLTTMEVGDICYDVAYFISHFESACVLYDIKQSDIDSFKELFFKAYTNKIAIHEEQLLFPTFLVKAQMIESFEVIPKLKQWASDYFK